MDYHGSPCPRAANLKQDIDQNHEKRISQVKYQPDLHRLDVGGGWEAGGDREVDRGQDHHAGDVDRVDHVILKEYHE